MQDLFDLPNNEVPTLASSAMLVELSIGVWTGRRLDKEASKATAHTYGASDAALSVTKRLLPDSPDLKAIEQHAAKCRVFNQENTMPWSDSNLRIVPTMKYFDHRQRLSDMQVQFYALRDRFLQSYAWDKAQAQHALGTVFNEDDYPDADKLEKKFYFNLNYLPVPTAGDWRVDLTNEAIEQLRGELGDFHKQAMERQAAEMWRRCYDPIARLAERIDYRGESDKKIFRDNTVDAVAELVDMLETFNITGDPALQEMQDHLRQTMQGISAEDLRKDGNLRAITKQKLDAALANLPSLGF
jgi:hypothetical protein